jgi:hypothetical protein
MGIINQALNERWKFYSAVVEAYNLQLTKELMDLHLNAEDRAKAVKAIADAPAFWAGEFPAYKILY